MKSLHRARRLALQALCCVDVQGRKAEDAAIRFIDDSDEQPEMLKAARTMLTDALGALGDCDAILTRHARNWELSRLALVDRNILRLAVQELRGAVTPFRVVIAESLKLAAEFSTAESPRFINGVLDAVAREIKPGGARSDQPPANP